MRPFVMSERAAFQNGVKFEFRRLISEASATEQTLRLLVGNFNFIIASFLSDKAPSLRQLSGKSSELELPLLRPSGEDLEEEEEGEEITLH